MNAVVVMIALIGVRTTKSYTENSYSCLDTSFSDYLASSATSVKKHQVSTLSASATTNSSGNCCIYWLASMRCEWNLSDSERISANELDAKFRIRQLLGRLSFGFCVGVHLTRVK